MHKKSNSTSWQSSGKWYDGIVGQKGHYYHQNIIIPKSLELLEMKDSTETSLLDLACGQGVLSRHIPNQANYVGLDAAKDLIRAAQEYKHPKNHEFIYADVTQSLPLKRKDFTHTSIILALQNIEEPVKVFRNAAQHLCQNGKFLIILNHPCFRIPRQSSWQIDQNSKIQYRRIDSYMSDMKIPIQTHPSQGKNSTQTWSFHHSLSMYSKWLKEAGFYISTIEEWCSDKTSEGKAMAAKMENKSRNEIPMFMALLAVKK